MLTKQDFEFLAETVQESWACQRIPLNKRGWLASRFADWIERRRPTNPRFDRDKFIQACGLFHTGGTNGWRDNRQQKKI